MKRTIGIAAFVLLGCSAPDKGPSSASLPPRARVSPRSRPREPRLREALRAPLTATARRGETREFIQSMVSASPNAGLRIGRG